MAATGSESRPTPERIGVLADGKIKARVFHVLQRIARSQGMDLQPRREFPGDMARFLALQSVDLVLDVGAASGMYGKRLREGGFEGRICSFEPLKDAHLALEKASAADPGWTCRRLALGAAPGTAKINVSGNSDSSSLLPMRKRHEESYPVATYIATETVELSTVDNVWGDVVRPGERVFLKLDVQGYEMEVLRGAPRALPLLHGLQVELSLVPLYETAPAWTEVITYLQGLGFYVALLQPAFDDPKTGEVLQVDGIFTRESRLLTRVPD